MSLTHRPAAIILDRDGVLNELWHEPDLGIVDSPSNPAQVRLVDGAARAVRRINEVGIPCYVASNQPGIAKRKMTAALLAAVTARIVELLAADDAVLDGIGYCVHHPDATVPGLRADCPDRKPGPGLLLRVTARLGARPRDCWFIGDTATDILAGRAVGMRTAWVGHLRCDGCPTRHSAKPDLIATSTADAVSMILGENAHAVVSG